MVAFGSPESQFITFEFEAASLTVDKLLKGIDYGLLDSDGDFIDDLLS